MTHLRLIILGSMMALWPSFALAAVPAVTGIVASYENGQIHVSWTAPSEPAQSFRIYYSRESILQNNGRYDDFETTSGNRTEYFLTNFPTASHLYISVLAVAMSGEEGKTFTTETTVDLPSAGTATSTMTPPSSFGATSSTTTAATLQLLSALPISSTGVTLTFNAPIELADTDGPSAFVIQDGSGHQLSMRKLVIMGAQIMIVTDQQQAGTVYNLQVNDVVKGQGMTTSLPLDPFQRNAQFTAWDALTDTPSMPTETPASIVGLTLNGQVQSNGRYTVTAHWGLSAPAAVVQSFELMQSRDGGKKFSAVQTIAGDTQAVTFHDVPFGAFGVSIRAVMPSGQRGPDVFSSIDLPKPQTNLPSSGPGVLLLMGTAGAVAGWRKMRLQLAK